MHKQQKRGQCTARLRANNRQLGRTVFGCVAGLECLRTDDVADGEGPAHYRGREGALGGTAEVCGRPLCGTDDQCRYPGRYLPHLR